MPIEISQKGKFKKGGYQDITSEYSPAFINTLESTNEPVALHRLIPSLISKQGAALGEQVIDFSVL
jgi:hypothetical protein